MPASELSIRLTDAYRTRLSFSRSARASRQQDAGPRSTSTTSTVARRVARGDGRDARTLPARRVSLTLAYVTAFIASELNRAPSPPPAPRATVGVTDDGRPLAEALVTSLIAVKAALKDKTRHPRRP
jgi:hypothetical protein